MKISFKKWLEMAGTGVVYDPKVKPVGFNWWGAPPGRPVSYGTVVKESPIKNWTKKKRK